MVAPSAVRSDQSGQFAEHVVEVRVPEFVTRSRRRDPCELVERGGADRTGAEHRLHHPFEHFAPRQRREMRVAGVVRLGWLTESGKTTALTGIAVVTIDDTAPTSRCGWFPSALGGTNRSSSWNRLAGSRSRGRWARAAVRRRREAPPACRTSRSTDRPGRAPTLRRRRSAPVRRTSPPLRSPSWSCRSATHRGTAPCHGCPTRRRHGAECTR